LRAVLGNVGLLTLAAVVASVVARRLGAPRDSLARRLTVGTVLGVTRALVVLAPVHGPPGASFDARAAPVALAGVFGGPVGGALAAAQGGVLEHRAPSDGGAPFVPRLRPVEAAAAAVRDRPARRTQRVAAFFRSGQVRALAGLPAHAPRRNDLWLPLARGRLVARRGKGVGGMANVRGEALIGRRAVMSRAAAALAGRATPAPPAGSRSRPDRARRAARHTGRGFHAACLGGRERRRDARPAGRSRGALR
jgi:hypothetical protein